MQEIEEAASRERKLRENGTRAAEENKKAAAEEAAFDAYKEDYDDPRSA